ncbi:MAG: YhcH/YjgK/YiaL family protein [Bacteroidia bacterium]
MIFDKINNAEYYYSLDVNIKKGLEFLKNTKNLKDLAVGKHEIDGDNVFALVQHYETKDFEADKWEAHKKYLDIQFMVSGNENIAVARIEDMTPNTEYKADGDYWLFTGNGNNVKMSEGCFLILTPQDIHQPAIVYNNTKEKVIKIVVKTKI